jgi:hypothetical protein
MYNTKGKLLRQAEKDINKEFPIFEEEMVLE